MTLIIIPDSLPDMNIIEKGAAVCTATPYNRDIIWQIAYFITARINAPQPCSPCCPDGEYRCRERAR